MMSEATNNPMGYYAGPGLMTDAAGHADLFDGLPTEIPVLCQVVQGLLLHVFWAERYGVELSEERQREVEIRQVSEMLARIQGMDDRPLTVDRPLDKKLVGNCRDFSVLLCAMLRARGVPARARCGFGAYFTPGMYEDHWVCEYWNGDEGRWVLVDAQLDALQREVLGIPFDPCDVPRDQFLVGGKAWRMCRAGEADPEKFGIFDMHGLWFIRGDLVRDLLALNKVEVLPWDGWGVIAKPDEELSPDDIALLDRVAELTFVDAPPFAEVRAIYEGDARLRTPAGYAVDPQRFDLRTL
ncbi:MAG TPA: transglutaminase-like domain-containing protein [Anaerolineae bacterium]|nr:transglutaminase-like domain-containing protein [Anaerolineae bacterium]